MDSHYAPNRTIASQQCNGNKENIPLDGSYIIELPTHCRIKMGNQELRTYQSTKTNNIKLLEVPTLKFQNYQNQPSIKSHFEPIQFANIELDDLKHIQNKLVEQEHNLHDLDEQPVHFHKISFWTIIFYVTVKWGE